MPKLLISGFIGSENLGDEAILKSILANTEFDLTSVNTLSVNPAKTRSLGIGAVPAKKPRVLAHAIRDCDVFLVGGGGILQDQTSILNFLYYMAQLYLARRYGKRTILMFVGVGPIKYRLSQFLLRRLVRVVNLAIVRDDASMQHLTAHGVARDNVVVAHDPVLNFQPEGSLDASHYTDTPYIAVSLRRWFFTHPLLPVFVTRRANRLPVVRRKYTRLVQSIAEDLDEFLSEHPEFKVILVSFNDREDRAVIEDVRNRIHLRERVECTPPGMSENEYLNIARDARFVLGMRLHSLILAATVGTPLVGLRYSLKVDEFIDQMDLRDASIHVEDYDSRRLQDAMELTLKERDERHDHVVSTVRRYRDDNVAAFRTLQNAVDTPPGPVGPRRAPREV